MLATEAGLSLRINPIHPFLSICRVGISRYPFPELSICAETAVASQLSHPEVFCIVVPLREAFTMFVQMTWREILKPRPAAVLKVKSIETARFTAASLDITR